MEEEVKGLDLKTQAKIPPAKHPGGRNIFIGFGIKKYSPHFKDLNNPVKDLTDLTALLKKEYDFSENDCFIIQEENASRDSIEARLKALIENKEIGINDNLILYFSGHGIWDATWKRSYFIPYIPAGNKVEGTSSYLSSSDLIVTFLPMIPCFHLLVILDCCFAGGFAMEANKKNEDIGFAQGATSTNEHLQNLFSKKSRHILTSGWREAVSDGKGGENSPFAKALITSLRDSDDINFLNLYNSVSALTYTYKGSTVSPMPFDPTNHDGGEFVFFRNESGKPVPKDLKDAFSELNFKKQVGEIKIPKVFNLVYLKGTPYCGHHLFVSRFFKERGRMVDVINQVPYHFKCGTYDFGRSYNNLWEICSFNYCNSITKLSEKSIVESIFGKLTMENSLLMLKAEKGGNDNKDDDRLFDFWSKLNQELLEGKYPEPTHDNRFFLFFLDKRGDEGVFDFEAYNKATTSPLARLIHFSPIQKVHVEDDLKDWWDIKKQQINATKFSALDFKLVPEEEFIANAIHNISEQCGRIECYDQLFFKHWKP